jgi:hypothetical protein
MALVRNDHGPAVLEVQRQLLALGYALPRWGDDGHLGDETLAAVREFEEDHDLATTDDDAVSDATLAAVAEKSSGVSLVEVPSGLVDCTADHDGKARIRKRAWGEITGITLHQTACDLGEKPKRWHRIPVQVGVTRGGKILLLNPIEYMTYHGNGLNASTVGIECEGRYEGIEGKPSTFWKAPGHPELWEPEQPTDALLASARQAVLWICTKVARHGGKIRSIYAHRQASAKRQSDPGSRIWQDVAGWAVENLGLLAPVAFTLGTGLPIPRDWDDTSSARY